MSKVNKFLCLIIQLQRKLMQSQNLKNFGVKDPLTGLIVFGNRS
jgi:hypothetical protein